MITSGVEIIPIQNSHQELVAQLLEQHWGSRMVVSREKMIDASKLPGFLARDQGNVVGLVTLHYAGGECEVVTLDAFEQGKGIDSTLLREAEKGAQVSGCKRIWLITSNDNVEALAFYQKKGLRLVAVHRDAITRARKLKPQIPMVAPDGIPIVDEIELEKLLK